MTHNEGRDGPRADPAASPAVRGTARARLRDAARRLIAAATLDDLTSFITVRRLTEDTGLSSGAVYSAFAPDTGVGARSRSAPQAAGRDAFWSLSAENDSVVQAMRELFLQLVDVGEVEGQELLEDVAEVLAGPITEAARGTDDERGWSYTHLFLGAASALNDPEVGQFLGRAYDDYAAAYLPGIEALLELTGRELVDGVDHRQFADLLISAADGCALRLRIDPDADPSIVRQMYLSIFVALTRRVDDRDDRLGHRLAIVGKRPLDEDQQEAVRRSVLRVYGRAGWPAVTLAKVAQLSGVSDARLAGRYRSRHELATMVWADVVAGIERRDGARASLAPGPRLAALLEDLCDTACAQRALVTSLLTAQLHANAERSEPEDDPRSDRLVEVLASSLLAVVGADGVVEDADPSETSSAVAVRRQLEVMARGVLDVVLMRAATSTMSGQDLGRLVVDSVAGAGVPVEPSG